MQTIDNITDDAKQTIKVSLIDGTVATIGLIYRPAIQRWTANIAWKTFSWEGIDLCVHPNLLRQWRNLISFGLMCSTVDGADPVYQQDFINGRASLIVLSAVEVAGVETDVIGQPT
jgi:hypothetical protein